MTVPDWWLEVGGLGVIGLGPLVCGAVIVSARLAPDALAPVVAPICAHSYLIDQWSYLLGILGLLLYLYGLDWRARHRSSD